MTTALTPKPLHLIAQRHIDELEVALRQLERLASDSGDEALTAIIHVAHTDILTASVRLAILIKGPPTAEDIAAIKAAGRARAYREAQASIRLRGEPKAIHAPSDLTDLLKEDL